MSATPGPDLVLPELLQGQWTTAIFSTYGADLTFFENRLLSQLAQVPLRIIMADNDQLSGTLGEAASTGQRHRLANKAYVAAPIRHPRSAHAKLILLLSPSNGLLIVGSGNLGYDGYAAPGELWHLFSYTECSPKHLNEFTAARNYVDGLISRGALDPPVAELLQTAWGQATWLTPSAAHSAAITSNLHRPILDQLRDAVSEPVEEMIAYAPFHDADCAALQELVETFAPDRVRLLLTEATSANPLAVDRVLADSRDPIIELVQVKAEPAAYIHAKWVHLIHPESETLLTGSANLSRSALLRSATKGNIEIGVISSGNHGVFERLYSHLQRTPIKDVCSLGISFRGGADDDPHPSTHPVVLWSRLDGARLTLVFDRALPEATTIQLQDHAGRAVTWDTIDFVAAQLRFHLTTESAELVADGGKVQVRIDGDDDQISATWPYNLAHLRSRLDKAHQRKYSPRLGNLPQQDADLFELLQELEQTLIIDRTSVWRIARPNDPEPPTAEEGGHTVKLEHLDWERIRRDHRHSGYFTRGRSADLPPTEIQVILAAIAGRLGDLGIILPSGDGDDDDDLAREGDTTSSDPEEAENAEDELEAELARRRVPISTRTRMAFDRFVRRYAAALDDSAFIDDLGSVPAVKNAVVFNHVLIGLLERGAVSPNVAIDSQVKTWRFLWGNSLRPGIASVPGDDAEVVSEVLIDASARAATLRGIAASAEYVTGDTSNSALRDTARHVLTDAAFDLDADQLCEAWGSQPAAHRLLDILAETAAPTTDDEIFELVLGPNAIPRSAAEWRHEPLRRPGRGDYKSNTFVLKITVHDLTPDRAKEMLGRVAVAAYYAGHESTYFRIRFEGNGKAVAFWDEDVGTGVVMIGEDDQVIVSLDPQWPAWSQRLGKLRSELNMTAVATA